MPNNNQSSTAFELLDRSLQKWIYKEQWNQLRDIQEVAIPIILEGKKDVIIASATASGKTEASYLPILTNAIRNTQPGVFAIYIGPLKALINDQYHRLIEMCKWADVNITPWHGDIAQNKKKNLLNKPSGLLLITPESLESIFINHGTEIEYIFSCLEYVIIDELHSFIGNERGRHLQSLLNRLELTLKKRIVRIGLSATLGDREIAKKFLSHKNSDSINYIESKSLGTDVKLQIRGYLNRQPELGINEESEYTNQSGFAPHDISKHIFDQLRGRDNLIFANRRMEVELYADLLRTYSEKKRVPNEFWPHHGSLAKDLRETIESELKDKNKPSTAVCTTTLEMGIDIGSVESIAQIGCPPSVSSLRQRLGRSGRRDNSAIMRIYISEDEITKLTSPQDRLRAELVQSIAMVNLLIEKWIEPPTDSRLHLSTLIQQILSIIGQYGGVRAIDAWEILFNKGSFSGINKSQFTHLLRKLGEEEIITQVVDGTLTLGIKGERIIGHYSFYAAFNTPEEYTIIANGRNIGSLPIEFPLIEGVHIIFAGKRWIVISVDEKRKTVELKSSKGGKPPRFGGSGAVIDDRIREEMLNIYSSESMPNYLDKESKVLLREGRKHFIFYNLKNDKIIEDGKDTLLFVWKGSVIQNTLLLLFLNQNIQVSYEGLVLRIKDTSKEKLIGLIQDILNLKEVSPFMLVKNVKNKEREKYDYLLPPQLLNLEFANRFLSIKEAISYLKGISTTQ